DHGRSRAAPPSRTPASSGKSCPASPPEDKSGTCPAPADTSVWEVPHMLGRDRGWLVRRLFPGILLACAGVAATAGAQEQPMVPLPPSFEGKVVVRDAAGNYVPLARSAAPSVPAS